MNFIKVTAIPTDGSNEELVEGCTINAWQGTVFVSTREISVIEPHEGGSMLHLRDGDMILIQESPEELVEGCTINAC